MSEVQIAIIDQEDTQITLAVPGVQGPVGNAIPSGGTTNQVLFKSSATNYDATWGNVTSAMITDLAIVDADVNASAAIAGSKISPNFGAQNVVTTGTNTAASFIPTSATIPSNGIYLPGANQVAVATNGVERVKFGTTATEVVFNDTGVDYDFRIEGDTNANLFFVDASTDRIGIGTGSPHATLQVHDGSFVLSKPATGSERNWRILGADTAAGDLSFSQSTTAGGSTYATKVTFGATGNVGIGTGSPGGKLDVRDAGTTIPALGAVGTGLNVRRTDGAIGLIIGYENTGGSSYIQAQHTNGSATAYALNLQPNGGAVGIGGNITLSGSQSTPKFIFANGDGDDSHLGIKAGSSAGAFSQIDVVGNWNGSASTGGRIAFTTGGTERARIRADGTFEIKGAGTAGTSPGFSVNPSTPANSFVIDSSGRLGIGNSSPRGILHVGADLINGATDAAAINLKQTGTTAATGIYLERSAERKGYYIYLGGGDDSLNFQRNNNGTKSDVMTLTRDGLAGIGTTGPTELLHLYDGGTSANQTIKFGNPAAAFYGSIKYSASSSEFLDLTCKGTTTNYGNIRFFTGATPSQAVTIDSSQRLLVGTSTSSADVRAIFQGNSNGSAGILTVSKTTNNPSSGDDLGFLQFADSGHVRAAAIFAQRDGGTWTSGSSQPTRLVFSTTPDTLAAPVERMKINSLGAFKATTTGSYAFATNKMHELRSDNDNRSVWVSNTNAAPYGIYIKYEGNDPNGTGNEFLVCDGNVTIRASIRSNGGLANYSANNANLSDRNVKKDIALAAGTWDCIKEWEIVNYRYKDQPDNADLNLGVIAQQVAESCPEVITIFQEAKDATEDKPAQEERLGVKEQQMMWMAIKALQEAMGRIEVLEAEVAALKGA